MSRKALKQHEAKIADSVKDNPKVFWKYVKSKTKTKTSVSDLYMDDSKEKITKTVQEKANTLADFFT